jgi:hypothetical protein
VPRIRQSTPKTGMLFLCQQVYHYYIRERYVVNHYSSKGPFLLVVSSRDVFLCFQSNQFRPILNRVIFKEDPHQGLGFTELVSISIGESDRTLFSTFSIRLLLLEKGLCMRYK